MGWILAVLIAGVTAVLLLGRRRPFPKASPEEERKVREIEKAKTVALMNIRLLEDEGRATEDAIRMEAERARRKVRTILGDDENGQADEIANSVVSSFLNSW